MDNNGTYSWTPPGKAKRPRGDFKKFSKIILVAVVVLALMIGSVLMTIMLPLMNIMSALG